MLVLKVRSSRSSLMSSMLAACSWKAALLTRMSSLPKARAFPSPRVGRTPDRARRRGSARSGGPLHGCTALFPRHRPARPRGRRWPRPRLRARRATPLRVRFRSRRRSPAPPCRRACRCRGSRRPGSAVAGPSRPRCRASRGAGRASGSRARVGGRPAPPSCWAWLRRTCGPWRPVRAAPCAAARRSRWCPTKCPGWKAWKGSCWMKGMQPP